MALLAIIFVVLLFLVVLLFFPQRGPVGEQDEFMSWAYRFWRD